MSAEQTVYYSNKVEILYNRLKVNLFSREISSFCRRLIIVPSPAIKSWLMLRLASDPEVGIATGIEVAYLDQTIAKLCHFDNIPNPLELAFAIEAEIRKIIQESTDPLWKPLFDYLKVEQYLSKKAERRLAALSHHLASLFKDYGIYGHQLTEQWLNENSGDWQKELWKRLFSQQFHYPSKLLAEFDINTIEVPRETRLYLFSISFMPKIYHQLLSLLAEKIPVHQYQLSPCQLFWSDILSDNESRRLQQYWKSRGITKGQQIDLEHFLRDRNAILANFGRIGREMAKQLEDSSALTEELYALPAAIRDEPIYEDMLTDEMAYFGSQKFTALDLLQGDITLLRHPDPDQKVSLDENDNSIQIHAASSKLRETQVVYDLIMGLIDKHSGDPDPLYPEDIIVMAPDIMDYQALIKAVFDNSESNLDYHVLDLEMPAQNELIQAFMHLMELPKTRWDSLSLLKLFQYRCFQSSQSLKTEDLQQISQWVIDLRILWGYDAEHRAEMLRDDYGAGLPDTSTFGSWESGFSRLLSQAVEDHDQTVSGTKLELAGQWISLIRTLKEDLKPVANNARKTIKEWVVYFKEMAEKYLGYNEKEESHQPFFDQLYLLNRSEKSVSTKLFGFVSLYYHLKNAFLREKISFRETHLHAVRFCTMLPMRAIPAKAIILMGMHEGAFPKQEQRDSLNLVHTSSEADYSPTATEYDRYLFLEALLSARQYFIATYQNTCSESGKEQPPSLLITEILTYLSQACTKTSFIFHHPFHAYDAAYFHSESAFRSYTKSQYQAALAYYSDHKLPQHQFLKGFEIDLPHAEIKEVVIDLKQLSNMAKDPIKAFLNTSLGLYLRDEEDPETEEKLVLSNLDSAILKREAIYKSLEETLSDAEQQGKLPPGIFKEVAVVKLSEDYEELKTAYDVLAIKPEEIFTIEFSEHCQSPVRIDNTLTLPPLEFSYKDNMTIKVTGVLPEVHQKGLLSHIDESPDELPKAWPEFLVFQALVDQYQLNIEKNLFAMKAGIKKEIAPNNPAEALRQYIDYYFLALNNVSPLKPKWTPKLMSGDKDKLQKAIANSAGERSYDEVMLWLCRQGAEISTETMVCWQEHAVRLFSEPMQKWMA